eukprot:1196222-Prorocentrum_minimum.AAC.3
MIDTLGAVPAGGPAELGLVPSGGSAELGLVPSGGPAELGLVPGGGSAEFGLVPSGGSAEFGLVPGGGPAELGGSEPKKPTTLTKDTTSDTTCDTKEGTTRDAIYHIYRSGLHCYTVPLGLYLDMVRPDFITLLQRAESYTVTRYHCTGTVPGLYHCNMTVPGHGAAGLHHTAPAGGV